MRNRIIIILTIVVSCIIDAGAQNIGYGAKRTVFGLGLDVAVTSEHIKPSVLLSFEQTIGYRHTLFATFSTLEGSAIFESNNYYISGFGNEIKRYSNDNPKPDMRVIDQRIEGNIAASVKTMRFGIKRYRTNTGAIAPFGKFVGFGLQSSHIRITDSYMYLRGYQEISKTEFRNTRIVLPHDSKWENSIDIGVFLSFGEKRFLNNKQFLEYTLSFNMDGFPNLRYSNGFRHQMSAAKRLAQQKILLPQFLNFSFTYGFAI